MTSWWLLWLICIANPIIGVTAKRKQVVDLIHV
jgi:hypothetical protein